MDTTTFLSEEERAAVAGFVGNKKAFEAVKKVLLFGIYSNGVMKPGEPHNPLFNWAMRAANDNQGAADNEKLGQQIRAMAEGINFLETAWEKLQEFGTPVEKKEKSKNPAV
jgi:hypothetical protein